MRHSYSAYRDSGVEWLPEIPDHWGVQRIKATSYLKGRVGWKGLTSDEFLEDGFAYLITGTDFRGKHIDWVNCYRVDQKRYEDDPFIQLRDGDLLITKDGTIGKLAIVSALDGPACLNSGIFLVRPLSDYITPYLYWVLSSSEFSHFCDLASYGSTIQHLYQNVFENFAFPVPTLPEQTTIAAFLDRETGKIDALVEEQRRLIELLKEKRQAAISHAVTKGLDPNAKMKSSGAEWLGDVPEHWTKLTLRHLIARIEQGWSPECENRQAEPGQWGVLKAGCANGSVFREGENKALPPTMDPLPELEVRAGDVLMSRANGSRENVGATAYVEDVRPRLMLSDKTFRLHPATGVRARYLALLLASRPLRHQIEGAISGADGLANNLPQSALKEFVAVLPPLIEQDAIIDRVNRNIGDVAALSSEVERAIALLQERRAALISATVTGKIDVRDTVAANAQPVPQLVAAEVIGRLCHMPTFGRVKFQKIVYLAEADAGISELSGNYLRAAAGPLDHDLIDKLEAALIGNVGLVVDQHGGTGGAVTYGMRSLPGAHAADLSAALGARKEKLDHIIKVVKDLDTKGTEAVATLYAVWNDFLLDGKHPTDDQIVAGFLNDWHPEKREKFRPEALFTWLGYMRRNGLTPSGRGPRTTTGRLFT